MATLAVIDDPAPVDADADAILAETRRELPSLLCLARRHSLCADDADDALQRALEILLRRLHRVQPESAVSWLRTVVKHEAMAVRSVRLRMVAATEIDFDAREAAHRAGPDEYAAALDRVHRSLAALAAIKPAESRALLLQAGGHTYAEIESATGWTHTKVNRALTEGRAAFRARIAALDAGAECQRLAPTLEALANGTAPLDRRITLRAHLRACAGCRAHLRELRKAAA
jgi:DNA-directed RNA polymerase specialized sigma24 family protein